MQQSLIDRLKGVFVSLPNLVLRIST